MKSKTNQPKKNPNKKPPLLNNLAVGLTQSWTTAAGCDFALERHRSVWRTAGAVPPQNLKGRPVVPHWYKSNYHTWGCHAESRSQALSNHTIRPEQVVSQNSCALCQEDGLFSCI